MIHSRVHLKILAMVLMLLDHIGYILLDNQFILRGLGRISFPLFVYLLIDGHARSHDVAKFAQRCLVLWLLSIVPYSFAFSPTLQQNIYASLFLYLGILSVLKDKRASLALKAGIVACSVIVAEICALEYGWAGVAILLVLYQMGGMGRRWAMAAMCVVNVLQSLLSLSPLPLFTVLVLVLVPDSLRKVQGGNRPSRSLQWAAYLFYPCHLLFLGLLAL